MIKLLTHLKKRDILFLLGTVALIVVQVWLDLTIPNYTAKLTTLIAMESKMPGSLSMSDIVYNGGIMLLCTVGSAVAAIICSYFTANIAGDWAYSLRDALFKKVTSFSNVEINKFTTPSLITRTTNDVVQCQTFMAMGVQLLIKAPITAIWAIFKLSNTSIEWMAATAAIVVAVIVLVTFLIVMVVPKFKIIQKLTDDLNDITRENVSGVRVIRAFNAEKYQADKFEDINASVMKTHLFTARSLGIMQPFMQLAMNGLTVIIYWIGAYLINEALLTDKAAVLGNMTAFTQIAIQVVMSFMMLVIIFIILPRAMVAANRIREVLDTDPVILDGQTASSTDEHGTVEFKNVTFSYSGDIRHPSLSDISFKVNKGETVAIIGPTGSGKTTLMSLLCRYYDTTAGEIYINGCNIRDYKIENLNNHISIAPQKAVLFSGDVKKNVTYGTKEFNADRFKTAIEVSQSSFIYDLEEKENAPVAQGGTNFSGGQKQRLSIARCLYKDSDILIFDDTFSALDYKTDMLIRKGIRENYKDKTVFIVAQRIGTIRHADKIIVIENGKVQGIGTHDELMKNCSVYQSIALSQLSLEELDGKERS